MSLQRCWSRMPEKMSETVEERRSPGFVDGLREGWFRFFSPARNMKEIATDISNEGETIKHVAQVVFGGLSAKLIFLVRRFTEWIKKIFGPGRIRD